MSIAHVIGIDPGLVHSGLVALSFDTDAQTLLVEHLVTPGVDTDRIKGWCATGWKVYIEQYRPRQRLQQDVLMVQLEQDLRRELPSAKFLPNMGIKKIVQQELMELLGVWSFSTPTHHQDLRSAARIALLGMMKDEVLNPVLASAVRDMLDGLHWTVKHG